MRPKFTEIEMRMDPNTFVQRHEAQEFPSGTALFVRESQEAIFMLNGEIADRFTPGRYKLDTNSLPLLDRLLSKVSPARFQFQKTFRAEIYFINKLERRGLKWGLDTKVNYLDPNFNNYPFPIGASGEVSLQVCDPRMLMQKIIGTAARLDDACLFEYFLAPLVTHIKSYLPAVLSHLGACVYDIDKYLNDISRDLQESLSEEMAPYGVELPMFRIMRFLLPENDKYYMEIRALRGDQIVSMGRAALERDLTYMRQDTAARGVTVDAQAQAAKRQIENYTYHDEQHYRIMQTQAAHPAAPQQPAWQPPQAPQAPQPQKDSMADFKEKVDRLLYMKSVGLLTEDEFQEEKRKLLQNLQRM